MSCGDVMIKVLYVSVDSQCGTVGIGSVIVALFSLWFR